MKKKIYISGPMSGIKDYNRKSFEDAEYYLKNIGYEPINPHKTQSISSYFDNEYLNFLVNDIEHLMLCEYIYMLEGWEYSYGAQIEKLLAKKFNKKIIYEYKNNFKPMKNMNELEKRLEEVENSFKNLVSYIDSELVPSIKLLMNLNDDVKKCIDCKHDSINCKCDKKNVGRTSKCAFCGETLFDCDCETYSITISKKGN